MQHFINHWSGGDGKFLYDLYSGLIPLTLTLLGLGIVGTFYKRLQCHDDSCHKLGLHHVAGGQFTVCGRHYRHVMGLSEDHPIDAHHIKQAHQDHLDSQSQT